MHIFLSQRIQFFFNVIGVFSDFGCSWDSFFPKRKVKEKIKPLNVYVNARDTYCIAISLPNMASRGILSTARARTILDGATRQAYFLSSSSSFLFCSFRRFYSCFVIIIIIIIIIIIFVIIASSLFRSFVSKNLIKKI